MKTFDADAKNRRIRLKNNRESRNQLFAQSGTRTHFASLGHSFCFMSVPAVCSLETHFPKFSCTSTTYYICQKEYIEALVSAIDVTKPNSIPAIEELTKIYSDCLPQLSSQFLHARICSFLFFQIAKPGRMLKSFPGSLQNL